MTQRSPTRARASGDRRFDDGAAVAVITCARSAVTVTPWSRASDGTCATSAVWPRGSSALIAALAASNAATWASTYAGSTPVNAFTSSIRPDKASISTHLTKRSSFFDDAHQQCRRIVWRSYFIVLGLISLSVCSTYRHSCHAVNRCYM